MQVSKQLLIRHISKNVELLDDVLNIIKDFCFYDMPTGIMRLFITECRLEICRIFNGANCISRNNLTSRFFGDPDTEEHWIFSINNPEYIVQHRRNGISVCTLDLQGVNCTTCGDYSHISVGTTEKNMCRCFDEDDRY